MPFKEYVQLVRSDLWRLGEGVSLRQLLWSLLFGDAFQYVFWMRSCRFLRTRPLAKFVVFPFAYLLLRHYGHKYGISIPYRTKIGSGFFIAHYSCIVVNQNAVIGKNCNLAQGVTLGKANRGKNQGEPIIGDNVYFGPGAKVVGRVRIGNFAALGANCVVTKDVPDYGVVGGVPAKLISLAGSAGYVNNTDYESPVLDSDLGTESSR